MPSTDKVLGTIGALNTLIDNFPMSILDLLEGKRYTSIFNFLIDVLQSCGVPVDEAVEWLLGKIFSFEINTTEGLDKLNERLAMANFKDVTESEFLNGLDITIKTALYTLLTSFYGCSTIPIIPNKVMDYPDPSIFSGATRTNKDETPKQNNWDILWQKQIYPARFEIPARTIDPMGILEIAPTTIEGRVFYDVEGDDVYYRKNKYDETISSVTTHKKNTNNIPLYFYTFNENNSTWLGIKTDVNVADNINISVNYLNPSGNNLLKWDTVIKIGETQSNNHILFLKESEIKIGNIEKIIINGNNDKCEIKYDGECYFSYIKSLEVINKYSNYNIFDSINWGDNNDKFILGDSINEKELYDEHPTVDDVDFIDEDDSNVITHYTYERINGKPEDFKEAKRFSDEPTTATKDSPDLIVVYKGINPNELYKSYDMNAFIWYVLNKSNRSTQIDINHTMWDSRLYRYRNTNRSLTGEEMTNWYNSKKTATDEFLNVTSADVNKPRITKKDNLYPILQLKKSPLNLYSIEISFPAQRYYKRTYRNKVLESDGIKNDGKIWSFNTTLYEFNYEYLKSIQLIKPKIMLTGFINYFLGGCFYEALNANFNITKNLIRNKIATATKKIIEIDDGEIEDCYYTFSNDEVNSMLENMLLSRHGMTQYNGMNNKVKEVNTDYYIANMDSINASTNREETVTKLTKFVEDISVTPGEDGYVEYGFETSLDKSILLKMIWAIVMPIVESILTPQIMLLIAINLILTGGSLSKNFGTNDLGIILNLIMNKLMSLFKSIIVYIKNKIVELLLRFTFSKLLPLITKWMAALKLESLNNWLAILTAAIKCLPTMDIKSNKLGGIDDVNYADIVNTDITSGPEAAAAC